MKKIVSVFVVFILCISLCACAKASKNSDFIGTWKGFDAFDEPTTITINENGTGSWRGEDGGGHTFTWEVKGDSIIFDTGRDKSVYTINRNASPFEISNGLIDPFVKSN